MNILIVDDDSKFRTNLKRLLEKNFDSVVLEAQNGFEGMSIFNTKNIELIFLDYEMPQMNAGQFLENLRKVNNEVPVVIITAHSDPEAVKDVLRFGISDFIIKADLATKLADRISQIFLSIAKKKSSVKILIVEDDERFRNVVRRLMERTFNVTITEAGNGAEGLEILNKFRQDIIFLDYDMPKMNGAEFMRILRETNKDIPVAVITAHAHKHIVTELLPYNITDYIVKADLVSKLTERVGNLFTSLGFKK